MAKDPIQESTVRALSPKVRGLQVQVTKMSMTGIVTQFKLHGIRELPRLAEEGLTIVEVSNYIDSIQ